MKKLLFGIFVLIPICLAGCSITLNTDKDDLFSKYKQCNDMVKLVDQGNNTDGTLYESYYSKKTGYCIYQVISVYSNSYVKTLYDMRNGELIYNFNCDNSITLLNGGCDSSEYDKIKKEYLGE